jgi:Xaa-Pro aminopeptidase
VPCRTRTRGDRHVERGETVVVDAGAVVDGYCADCTRTFATGKLPEELQRAYDVCLEAQLAGLDVVAPGVTGRDADAAAREVIWHAGLGEYFGHGLGHGVGLLVHEAPTLRPESDDTLAPNNVVTVEPGVYLPGLGGVRIEDLVVVRDERPVVLTPYTKELVTVG